MFKVLFWKAAAERAAKTAGQAAAIYLGGSALTIWTLDWEYLSGITGVAALLSVATSVASVKLGPEGSPSVVPDQAAAG